MIKLYTFTNIRVHGLIVCMYGHMCQCVRVCMCLCDLVVLWIYEYGMCMCIIWYVYANIWYTHSSHIHHHTHIIYVHCIFIAHSLSHITYTLITLSSSYTIHTHKNKLDPIANTFSKCFWLSVCVCVQKQTWPDCRCFSQML